MNRPVSSFSNVFYDEYNNRFESRVVLYKSEKSRLPPNLSSYAFLSGGYYKRELDAAKASDMLSCKLVRSMDNRQLTMKEYTQVDRMSWDELMVALKRRAERKEREVVSDEEEEEEEKARDMAREADPTNNRRNLDGSVPQSRFSCVYGTRSGRPWKVEVSAENIRCYMRAFESEEEAARLADRALFYLTGSKARLNFPDETPGPLEPEMAAKIDARRQALEAKQDQPDAEQEHGLVWSKEKGEV